MSYKIVATESRKGGIDITLCPSAWEENNILSWPSKMVTRLQKDPESQPEPYWKQHACIVKKAAIKTYEEALEWEIAFQNADTDGESELVILNKPRKILKEIHNSKNRFEKMFEGINENLVPNVANPVTAELKRANSPNKSIEMSLGMDNFIQSASAGNTNIMPNLENSMQSAVANQPILMNSGIPSVIFNPTSTVNTSIIPNIEKSHYLPNLDPYLPKSKANSPCIIDLPLLQIESDSQVETMNKKMEVLQAEVTAIKKSLEALHHQQQANTIKIMTVLDNISNNISKKSSQQNLEEPSENVPDNDILAKYILPVNDLTILKDMDKELGSEKYFSTMVHHFSSFVGTDGQGRGEVIGKKLAEQIMTRELMTKMSWTGVSRTAGCEKKFAFQTLENLVKLFYKVLIKADSRWSYEKNEKLFSGALLKHAKKRALAEKTKAENKKNQRIKIGAAQISLEVLSEHGRDLNENCEESNDNGGHTNKNGGDSNKNGGDSNENVGESNENGGESNENGGNLNENGGELIQL